MGLNLFQKLLTNNHRFTVSHIEYRRVFLLNFVLFALLCFCFYLSIVNLFFSYTQDTTTALIDAVASLLSLAILIYFHKTDNVKIGTYLTVLLLSIFLLAYLETVNDHFFGLSWLCIFPPVVFFLLGRKKGSIVTGIFLTYSFLYMFNNYKNWHSVDFTLNSIFNIMYSACFLVIIIIYYEQSRHDVAVSLRMKNKEINTKNNELKNSQDRLHIILNSTAEAICGIDMEGNCTFCNTSCLKLLGYTDQNDLLGKNMHKQVHHSHADGTPISIEKCKTHKTLLEGNCFDSDNEMFSRADGTSFFVDYHSYPQYKDGIIIGAVITFTNITARKKNEEQIKYLNCHDSLTGLYNREYFDNKLDEINTKKNLPISIIFADLDCLKMTNDIFGHIAGDELIKKTADIMKKVCRQEDVITRLGGDEFVILMPGADESKAKSTVSEIKSELSRERIAAIKCSMSLGCDTKIHIKQDIKQTMTNAENEMYNEKTRSRKEINSEMVKAIIESLHEKCPREKKHSIAISELCQKIGEAMKLPETEVKKLKNVGYLHDIGKIVLKDKTINKIEGLTAEDKTEIQQHSFVGFRILNLFDDTLNLTEGVYSHHERWDGSGYPKGLKGEEIPLQARVIAVAEVYESALIKYNKFNSLNMSKKQALDEVNRLSEIKLDPKIVSVFVDIMSKN